MAGHKAYVDEGESVNTEHETAFFCSGRIRTLSNDDDDDSSPVDGTKMCQTGNSYRGDLFSTWTIPRTSTGADGNYITYRLFNDSPLFCSLDLTLKKVLPRVRNLGSMMDGEDTLHHRN
jgi:hypothetical protein